MRYTILTTTVLCLISALMCIQVQADDTLTLQLPPSRAALEARAEAARVAAERAEAARRAATRSYRSAISSRGMSSWRGRRSGETTVGRLGQVMESASIHRAPGSWSHSLVMVQPGTYVAVKSQQEDWCGVLMADGSIGWLPTAKVRLLDYNVVSPSGGGLPGMGGGIPSESDQGDNYPRNSTPFFLGDAQALLTEAYKYLGVPYVWGGNTARGIDCSGFVKNVFGACGYSLPRLGSDQMAYGVPVPRDQLQAGDRLYFERRTDRVGIKHTGIYIGNGLFIHSSSSQHGVAINNLSEPFWYHIFVCARR